MVENNLKVLGVLFNKELTAKYISADSCGHSFGFANTSSFRIPTSSGILLSIVGFDSRYKTAQIFMDLSSDSNKIYYRSYVTKWNDWKEL